MRGKARNGIDGWLVSLPSMVWLVLFFLIPTALVFLIAFRSTEPGGGIGSEWTLEHFRRLFDASHAVVLWRTFWLSTVATGICLLLALPVAYWVARLAPAIRRWVLLLIIVPFWTSFLIRILAWRDLLHAEGFVKGVLVALGLVGSDAPLLYNDAAVLLVLVYTSLPFAILPLYAAAEKFDFQLLDAAMDLGASRSRAFRQIFLPGIRAGLLAAFVIVFIPALGAYAIPYLIGGTNSEMIGSVIARRVLDNRNLPAGAALSSILVLFMLAPVLLALQARRTRNRKNPEANV